MADNVDTPIQETETELETEVEAEPVKFQKNPRPRIEPEEEVSQEELEQLKAELCKDLPRINIAAALMPPIWGPANGSIITILFYPLWIFVDDLLYTAYTTQNALAIVLGFVALVAILAVSILYGMRAQKSAYIRYLSKGKTKEQWFANQKIWAIVMAIIAVVIVVAATVFNTTIRPTLG